MKYMGVYLCLYTHFSDLSPHIIFNFDFRLAHKRALKSPMISWFPKIYLISFWTC